MTISADQLGKLQLELRQQIETQDPQLFEDHAIDRYIAFFDALPGITGYRFVPAEAEEYASAIAMRTNQDGLEAYHKLVLVQLISQFDQRVLGKKLTSSIRSKTLDYLERVLTDMETPRKRFYRHSNDRFAKDFAVCRLIMFPCGVELIDELSGVSRSMLLNGGIGQFVSGMMYFPLRIGGFKPLYQLHFDQRLVSAFNEEGYTQLYLQLADQIAINPEIKGIMSASWWHDPVLRKISPDLGFIEKWPREFGAKFFAEGSSDEAIADATRFSPQRTALYKQGAYQPQVYVMVWARKDLLAWAENYRSRSQIDDAIDANLCEPVGLQQETAAPQT